MRVAPAITWFEVRVTDLELATKFYSTVFDVTASPWEQYALMSDADGRPVFALEPVEAAPPTDAYVRPTWDVEDLEATVELVRSAGGTVELEREVISEEFGWWALARDPFGNYLAFATSNPAR